MEKRINMQELQPQALKAMYGLEGYLQTTQLQKLHKELIKIRASQINGCAYCINMHTQDALKLGETNQRIFLLNAWRETDLFTEEEKAILQLTEEVTLIHQGGVKETTYQQVITLFGEEYVAQLLMMIITINAWNRIAISTKMQPGK